MRPSHRQDRDTNEATAVTVRHPVTVRRIRIQSKTASFVHFYIEKFFWLLLRLKWKKNIFSKLNLSLTPKKLPIALNICLRSRRTVARRKVWTNDQEMMEPMETMRNWAPPRSAAG